MRFFCFRRILNDLLYSHDSGIEISQPFLSKNIALKNQNAFFVSAIYYHFLLTSQVTLVPHLLFCAADEPSVKNFKIEGFNDVAYHKGKPLFGLHTTLVAS